MTAIVPSTPDFGIIMVADGDVLVRLAIAQYLRDCGYRVVEAASSDDVALVLDRSEVPVELVMCDIEIPGDRNGFALSHWMQEHHPDVDLMLVGSDAAAANAAADLCDRGPFLARPYEPKDVLIRIQTMFEERRRRQKRPAGTIRELVRQTPAS
ncbi:MAG: response regulator [Bauldia sp.]|nr:response regulator [Bauldia sp.]